MNRKDLYDSFNEVDDDILERSDAATRRKAKTIWLKWGAIAACLCLVVVGAFVAPNLIGEHGEEPPISSVSAIPYVKVNDTVYVIDSDYPNRTTSELTDDYVVIGKIERNPSLDTSQEAINGDAVGCKVGEKIFQSADNLNEVYIYTTLFSGNGEYRYIRFVCNTNAEG